MTEKRILEMIEVLKKRLKESQEEYEKMKEKEFNEGASWITSNSRGFYNGLISEMQIEIGNLYGLLSLLSKED